MTRRKILYIDLALENTVGHGFQYLSEFGDSLRQEFECSIFCNRAASPDLVKKISAAPVLSAHPTRELSSNFFVNLTRRVWLELTKSFFELRKVSANSEYQNILFFQHIEYFNLIGILGCKRASNKLIIVLRSDPLFGGNLSSAVRILFYTALINLVRLKFRRNVTFASDSPELSQVYERLSPNLQVPVALPPAIELRKNQLVQPLNREARRVTTVGYLGRAAPEKGFNRLPTLIPKKRDPQSYKASLNRIHFILDIFGADGATEHTVRELKLMASKSNPFDSNITISLNEAPASSADYNSKLGEIDIALLLYDSTRYKRQTSGVLFDCILSGVLPIVLPDTWLSGQIATLGAGRIYKNEALLDDIFVVTERDRVELAAARQALLNQPTVLDLIWAVTNE